MNTKAEIVHGYLPPDANGLLAVMDHCLRSRHYVKQSCSVNRGQPRTTALS